MKDININIYKKDGSIIAKGFLSGSNGWADAVIMNSNVLQYLLETKPECNLYYRLRDDISHAIEKLFSSLVSDIGEFVTSNNHIIIEIDEESLGDLFDVIVYAAISMPSGNILAKHIKFTGKPEELMNTKVHLSGIDSYNEKSFPDENDDETENETVSGKKNHKEKRKFITIYKQGDALCYYTGSGTNFIPDFESTFSIQNKMACIINFVSKISKDIQINLERGIIHSTDKSIDSEWLSLLKLCISKMGFKVDIIDIFIIDEEKYKPVHLHFYAMPDFYEVKIFNFNPKIYSVHSNCIEKVVTKTIKVLADKNGRVENYKLLISHDKYMPQEIFSTALEQLLKGLFDTYNNDNFIIPVDIAETHVL